MRILVYGFAHSGTTILRKLIGDHSKLTDIADEVIKPPELDDCVFKATHLPNWRFRGCKKIMIIKNPFDIFGSFYKRFGDKYLDIPGHKIEDYEDHVMHYLETNDIKIQYEHLELDMMPAIYRSLELEPEPVKDRVAYACMGYAVPDKEPPDQKEGANHARYRQWQINQPFINQTGMSAPFLPDTARELLENNEIINKLYDKRYSTLCNG